MEELLFMAVPTLGFVLLILFIVFIVKMYKKAKTKRSSCPGCNKLYSYPEDIKIICSSLKWEKKTKEEYKGDYKYEITYKVFYRIVTFQFNCSSCGHTHYFNRRFDLYRSDSAYSQSDAEEIALLKDKIRSLFDAPVFEGKDITIYCAED